MNCGLSRWGLWPAAGTRLADVGKRCVLQNLGGGVAYAQQDAK
jgi:hypothetical protein